MPGADRHPQSPRVDEPQDQSGHQDELHARAGHRPSAALRVLRRRGDAQPGPRPVGCESRPSLPAAQRDHPERGAVPDGGSRHRGHADGGTDGGLPAGRAVRRADRGRRPGPRPGAESQERGDDQDLGRRSPEDGAEAAGERLRGDHRRSAQEPHARRRAHLQSGGWQAAAEIRRRWLRARRPRPGCRRGISDDREAASEDVGGTEPAGPDAVGGRSGGGDRLADRYPSAEPDQTDARRAGPPAGRAAGRRTRRRRTERPVRGAVPEPEEGPRCRHDHRPRDRRQRRYRQRAPTPSWPTWCSAG